MRKLTFVMVAAVVFAGISIAEEASKLDPKVEQLLAALGTQVQEAPAVIPDDTPEADKAGLKESHVKLQDFVQVKLIPLCINPVFVEQVKAQNARNVSLDEIKKIDEEWTNAEDELPIHKEKLGNACAQEVRKLVKELKFIGECFVMDNQGANVGQNALTSDYWQGDEAKWKKPFNGGKGGIDIDKRKYDKSAGTVDQKVSLPIIDEKGNVIGAVCWGVQPDKL